MLILIVVFVVFLLLNSSKFMSKNTNCFYNHLRGKSLFEYENRELLTKYFNPSIIKHDNGYIMSVRKSNNILKNLFVYLLTRNENYSKISFITLDNNFKLERIISPKIGKYEINGEDPRLVYFNGQYLLSAVIVKSPKDIFPYLFQFDKDFNFISRRKFQFNEKRNNIEKNWCLFVCNDKLFLHTDTYPRWKVYHVILNSLECNKVLDYKWDLKGYPNLRCSTSWVKWDKTKFIVGLHVKQFGRIFPTIRSVLCFVDSNTFKPIKISKPFCVDDEHSRIQFLSGLEIDKNNLILTFGISDYKIRIISFSQKKVIESFHCSSYSISSDSFEI